MNQNMGELQNQASGQNITPYEEYVELVNGKKEVYNPYKALALYDNVVGSSNPDRNPLYYYKWDYSQDATPQSRYKVPPRARRDTNQNNKGGEPWQGSYPTKKTYRAYWDSRVRPVTGFRPSALEVSYVHFPNTVALQKPVNVPFGKFGSNISTAQQPSVQIQTNSANVYPSAMQPIQAKIVGQSNVNATNSKTGVQQSVPVQINPTAPAITTFAQQSQNNFNSVFPGIDILQQSAEAPSQNKNGYNTYVPFGQSGGGQNNLNASFNSGDAMSLDPNYPPPSLGSSMKLN